MKNALKIMVSFVLFFVVDAGLLLLFGGISDIVKVIISALIADVTWHILFYFVMPRISRKLNRAE